MSNVLRLPAEQLYAKELEALKEEDKRHIVALGGPTFKGMIRVAKSSPFMWSDIFKQNKNNVVEAINMFEKELNLCKDLIKDERWDELFAWMSDARAVREIL